MANKKSASTVAIEIKPVELRSVKVRIVGDTPLIMHAWSEKAKKEMLDAQRGIKLKKKEPKVPVRDFIDSCYWLSEKPVAAENTDEAWEKAFQATVAAGGMRFGFPACAVKEAACSAAYRNGLSKDKVSIYGSFQIWGCENPEMIEIVSDVPVMREDMVRVGMGTADLRYRGEFRNWHADLIVKYNANGQYSLDEIIRLINIGGFSCGLGEWRMEKGGSNGAFHVETAPEG